MISIANHSHSRAVFLVGTTASGKSDWALRFAENLQGVIFNCDSVQLYKDVKIGSAAPSAQDYARAKHCLYEYVQAPQEMTTGDYTRDFFKTYAAEKSKVNIVVGGTGFYFQALEKGMFEVAAKNDVLRKQLEDEVATAAGAEKLYAELQSVDPQACLKIHAADHYRIVRALEIYRMTGKKVSELHTEQAAAPSTFPDPIIKIGVSWDKEELQKRIQLRTEKMLKDGIVAETEALVGRGLKNWAPLKSVGYFECVQYLNQSLAKNELPEQISLKTGQLAKKQRTWFQRDAQIMWFHGSEFEKALEYVRIKLKE